MSPQSENASILPYYAYGKTKGTPYWNNIRSPKMSVVSDDFSFSFGINIPNASTCTRVDFPYIVEDNRLFYINLGRYQRKNDYETVLLIDGAIVSASVYLNGYIVSLIKDTLIGTIVRIDEYLKTTNHLFIKFDDNRYKRQEIIRSLRIVSLPKSRITDIYPRCSLRENMAQILCDVVLVSGDMIAALGGKLEVSINDHTDKEIAKVSQNISSFTRNYWKTTRVILNVNDPHLWEPDDTYRYTIRVKFLRKDDTIADIKEIPYGIRQLHFVRYSSKVPNSPALVLNNKPIRITGAVLTVQDEKLPKMLKAAGINAVRIINPYNSAFFEECDKEGILVMSEVALDVPYVRRFLFGQNRVSSDPLDVPFALLGEMIIRLKNYACIFCWSIGVRKPYGNTVIGEFIRSLDDTRAVNCQGDSTYLLSDFFSADDCNLDQLKAIESHSLVFENNILGIIHRPSIYKQYPFMLCDVDISQQSLKEKIDVFRHNERFLGLFLSAFDDTNLLTVLKEITEYSEVADE